MIDIKEIKKVKLVPFTLMTSLIGAILAFIAAIIILIVLGITASFIPQTTVVGRSITLLGIGLIFILPISAFFIGLAINFFDALLYNGLVPRLGGIKLGLEGNTIAEIPIISFTLILASIEAIRAFIIGIFLAAFIVPITFMLTSIPVVSQAIANATNTTGAAFPTGAALGTGGVILTLILVIAFPIIAFIYWFIYYALAALFYNYIATRVSKIKLEFSAISGQLYELKSVPVIPAALSIATVFVVFGFISGLINLITNTAQGFALNGVSSFIGSIIGNLIIYFIITALITIFYNYLASRIGGFKIKLE